MLSGGDIYTGLERGVIDATEWVGPYHDYLMGFYQIAKYYYTPGWHEMGSELEFIANKEKFNALPADLQEILRTAILRLNQWVLSQFEAQNSIYLEKLVGEEKVDLRQFPKDVMEKLKRYTKEVIHELVESDAFTKRVYESYDAFRKRAAFWARSSEKIFYDEMLS